MPNQLILESSLLEEEENISQISQTQQIVQEQLFSQQYSQMIQSTQRRMENLNLSISFSSNFNDLTTFPLRAQGR